MENSKGAPTLPAIGQDTLEELQDKERFFRDLEAGEESPVDYAVLNKQLTLTGTVTSFKIPDATGEVSEGVYSSEDGSMTPSTVGSSLDHSEHSTKEGTSFSSQSVTSASDQSSQQPPQRVSSGSEKTGDARSSDTASTTSTSSETSAAHSSKRPSPAQSRQSTSEVSRSSQHSFTESSATSSTLQSHSTRGGPQKGTPSPEPPEKEVESPLSSSVTTSQASVNTEEVKEGPSIDRMLPLPKSPGLTEDTRGFDLSPIHTSDVKDSTAADESSHVPILKSHWKSSLTQDGGTPSGGHSGPPGGPPGGASGGPNGDPSGGPSGGPSTIQPPSMPSIKDNTLKPEVFTPTTQQPHTRQKDRTSPSHEIPPRQGLSFNHFTEPPVSSTVIVASPSFVVHSPASLEKSLKDVYAQKSSIDKDIEEVQAALEAAGLSRLGETPQKDPQERGDIDIQSLLREITREEVISTSKQILHEQRKKASKSTPSASKPLPQSNKGDRSSSTGKTPIPTSHKKAPTTPSSRLPIRVRKLGDTPAMEKHHRLSNPVLNGNKKVSEDTVVIGAIDPSFHARELKLLEELSSLKEICEKEKKDRSEMEAKWMAREKEILQREEMVKLEHQKELKEIKAEMFTLSAKLREKNIREDTRKNLAQSGAVDDLSPEEKDRLEKEIKGQEKLLEGYQKENERLYHDLTRVQQELKSSKDLLTQENQILRTELANERAKQEIRLPPSHPPVHSTVLAPPSDGRVDALEDHLDRVQHENKKLHNKVVQLEQMVAVYETDIRAVAKERDELKKSITSLMPLDMVEGLKEKHRVEIVALEGKLKWYSENQRLFEQDADILRGKEEQIKELSWKLETAEEHIRNQKKVAKERGTDAKRIRDLERQIKEMETIIRRRFPNSITAMIYASSHDDKEGQKSESGTPQTSLYLERKVRALEKELEEKDEEHSRRTRALQQQYIAMEVSYEEEVKKLKGKVAEFKRLTASSKSEAQPHTTVHSLQKELERRKVVYQTRLAELQQEVSRLKRGGNKMADLTNRQVDEAVLGKKDVMHEEEEGAVDVFRKELVVRKREYQTIRKERDSLYQQVEKLCDTVREAEKEIAHYKEKSQSDLDQKQVDVMRQENEVLKDQLRQLQLASTQERVHLQNQLAQTETKSRQVKEDLEDKIGEIQEQHRKEVGHLVAKHAKEHSESVLIKMKAQLANQKVEIAHLKEKLEASQFDVEALIACKLREKGLEEKLRALALELIEAKRYHSPEMHHYNVLLTRIVSLENKLNQLQEKKELCLQQLAVPSQHALHEVEKKWRVRLLEKDAEIENFRSQIDDILVALNSLNPSQFPRQS